jgi:glycosyltransferase involved in cell wall biosynthesis
MTTSAEPADIDVSVVIPVHNNAATLGELCRRVAAVLPGSEVIVVDDRSTDAFAEVVDTLDVDTIALARRSGQSEAIRQGLARARGSVCCILDADLEDPPEALPLMIAALRAHDAQVAFSSRDGRRRLTSRVFRRLMRLLYPTLTPRACLCFAMVRQAAAAVVRTARPGDYLVAVIGALRLRSVQVRVVRDSRRQRRSGYPGWRRTAHGVRTVAAAIRLRWQVSTGLIRGSSR